MTRLMHNRARPWSHNHDLTILHRAQVTPPQYTGKFIIDLGQLLVITAKPRKVEHCGLERKMPIVVAAGGASSCTPILIEIPQVGDVPGTMAELLRTISILGPDTRLFPLAQLYQFAAKSE